MAESKKTIRLTKAAREFNVGISTIVDYLHKKGYDIEGKPNTKISPEVYEVLVKAFQSEKTVKEEAKKIGFDYPKSKANSIEEGEEKKEKEEVEEEPESDQDELFIRNFPLEYNKSQKKEKAEQKQPESMAEQAETAQETSEKEPEVEPEAEERPKAEDQSAVAEEPPQAKGEEESPKPKEKPEKQQQEKQQAMKTAEQPASEVQESTDKEPEHKTVEEPEENQPVAEKEKKKQKAETGTAKDGGPRVLGKIDIDSLNTRTRPPRKSKTEKQKEREATRKTQKGPAETSKDKDKTEQQEKTSAKPKPAKKKVSKPATRKTKQKQQPAEEKQETQEQQKEESDLTFLPTDVKKLEGPRILGSIDLPGKRKRKKSEPKPVASSTDDKVSAKKKKRRRIKKSKPVDTENKEKESRSSRPKPKPTKDKRKKPREEDRPELTEEEIQKQIKETMQRLSGGGSKSKGSKHRRIKRQQTAQSRATEEEERLEKEQKILKVTEFVTVNELATMMNATVTEVISTCMNLGLVVSINQRLDAETLNLVADEFGYEVEFVSVDVQEAIDEQAEEDKPEDMIDRSPVVTVMGHVDHGKTSLLDHIRKTNVIAGEAGGITQHVGAYEVELDGGKGITFLDTPGHEAFTAMRARGAQVTDIAIIVVAADDTVMPQTVEAINHAQAAGVPIIFAINKVDKHNANVHKIKEELSNRNLLVEEWGGKYQSQDISAKKGDGIHELLEKVLLEAELLELKGNPNKHAYGTVLESALDRGRGYTTKILIQSGTLKIGDMVLAGSTYGKVKAMYNERNQPVEEAGPSSPVLMLGLNGAPQAGDKINVMEDEREVKQIANKRFQLQREQGIRTQKHITLDEIGRRIAIGDFKELNIIVKGDTVGSVEALSDELLKLSKDEVQVNVIHKSVGQIIESDVLLASASDAVIIGFQVRPSSNARKIAEQEQIDIRSYSVIYKAIDEIKLAIEGMLSPDIEERIVANLEVRDTFKITKVGTVAGCMVLDGKITRKTKVRLIRDGIVIYLGYLGSLKRFKEDVREVSTGYECGLNIEKFNDIKVGDIIEGFEEVEVKRKL